MADVRRPEGIRIRHSTIRPPAGATHHWVAVVDLSEPIPNSEGIPSPICAICQVDHGWHKVRHVEIDQDGYGIVSEGVWEGLQHVQDAAGFVQVNTVTDPPAIILRQTGAGTFDRTVAGRDHVPIISSPKE